ncbi:MAG: hypothetical protein DLM58_19905 [Pseudonocardiales bacterium]|nr:MAG: hypothetical protein DLM58_19905 [Pseudonocardiales bacterium]
MLDDLLFRQYEAAVRLDRTARILTFIAWLAVGLAAVLGFILFVIGINNRDPGFGVLGLVYVVGGFVLFLPAYFVRTGARAYAAKSLVDAEMRWRERA